MCMISCVFKSSSICVYVSSCVLGLICLYKQYIRVCLYVCMYLFVLVGVNVCLYIRMCLAVCLTIFVCVCDLVLCVTICMCV